MNHDFFLDSFRVILRHPIPFLIFALLITGLYVLAHFLPKIRRIAVFSALWVQASMFIFCISVGAPLEVVLLLLLASAVPALLT